MHKPKVSIIAAIASGNRALGRDNDLIYKIPEDLKRFRELTSGHTIVMGRKTYDSIGRLLPNRTNIIVTRDVDFRLDGAVIAHSVEEALRKAEEIEKEEVFIIGGGQIYEQALPLTDRLYLTVIEGSPDADIFFPDYSDFKKVISEDSRLENGLKFSYLTLEH